MRFKVLLAGLLLATSSLFAEVMVVHFVNGSSDRIPVAEVQAICFKTGLTPVTTNRPNVVPSTDLFIGAGGRNLVLTLDRKSSARITVYNAYGQMVRNVRLSEKEPGTYRIDMRSRTGNTSLARGFYFAHAVIGGKNITKKIIITH